MGGCGLFAGDGRCRRGETEYLVGLGREAGVAENLCVQVGAVDGPVDFEYPDQAEVDLLFDVVDEHEKVFALLRVCGLNGGDGDDCTVVFHDDSR